MDTQGGLAGGLARGIQNGISLGSSLFNQAQDYKLRQEELALSKRAQDRYDQEQAVRLHSSAITAARDSLGSLSRLAAAAKAGGRSDEQQQLEQRIGDLNRLIQYHTDKIIAPEVDQGITQARQDAAALHSGEKTPEDLGPMRFSRVVGMTGHQPISFINGYDHNGDGEAEDHGPISSQVQQVHYHMDAGNYDQVPHAIFPLLHPYLSPHPDDHEHYFSGLNVPEWSSGSSNAGFAWGLANDVGGPDSHAYIGKALDTVGALGTIAAAINSDPQARQLLIDGHQQGATSEFRTARDFLQRNGGTKNLPRLLAPDGLEQSYVQARDQLTAGGTPAQQAQQAAAAQVGATATDDVRRQMRNWYLLNGQEIPEDLKESEKEKAIAALQKAGTPVNDATLWVYAPEIATERMKQPLQRAQIDEARARTNQANATADYTRNLKGQRLHTETGSDGNTYNYNPVTGEHTDLDGNPAPSGLRFFRQGVQHQAPTVYMTDPVTFQRMPGTVTTDSEGNQVRTPIRQGAAPAAAPQSPSPAVPQRNNGAANNPLINPATGRYWGQ